MGLLSPVRAGSAVEATTGDIAFLQAMLDAEAALARVVAPAGAAEAVAGAARAELYDVRDLALRARSGGNPVIPLVTDLTAAVARTDREAASYVHRGATSQDIVDTAAMLVAARALPLIVADLERTAAELARLATAHRDTPMPGRTLTQHAVPTTFGLKAAGWRALVLDARDRLATLRPPAQLGGAAGTLAAFEAGAGAGFGAGFGTGFGAGAELLARFAEETGLAEPELPWHTLRTPIADLGTALAFAVGALGKVAADVLVLSRTEIGEVAEGAGGGSSAMPHKSNPVRATLMAAAARQAPQLAATLLGSLAAEDERPGGAWHAEWQTLRELLRIAGGSARDAVELTSGLKVFPDRMAEHLRMTGGLIVSERLAAALAPAVGRARAKELLAEASRRGAEEGVGLAEALAGVLPAERLRELTEPGTYLGSAPALVDRALARDA
ncbi:3-carboxy-cis,cis-muconate cycloisomerase [Streptomyces malaysiensis]|uniref:3-carboxy-cis,cis-muconate cycloisomerase n=1 Tax=Streptomyces malaysiensis TaxID=92644 RepID=UPI002B31E3C7|nr:3-carboxy-cis,cis-muconate cycloisomerase [Streptomyces malaysiensis]